MRARAGGREERQSRFCRRTFLGRFCQDGLLLAQRRGDEGRIVGGGVGLLPQRGDGLAQRVDARRGRDKRREARRAVHVRGERKDAARA